MAVSTLPGAPGPEVTAPGPEGTIWMIPNGNPSDWRPAPGEMYITELPDGVFQMHDPLFEEPYRFGDGSLVRHETTDKILAAAIRYYSYMNDSRQMGHGDQHAIQEHGGRMARLGHMLQCVRLVVHFDSLNPVSSPDPDREALAMGLHDAGHRMRGHADDHSLQSRGPHTAHDHNQPGFLERSGFAGDLRDLGLCFGYGDDAVLGNGVYLSELAIEEDDGSGALSYSTASELLDFDRLGYNLMQLCLAPGGVVLARALLADMKRVNDPEHGDQLIFKSQECAALFSLIQADHWYRYWASRENMMMAQLLQMMTRHMLTTRHELMEPYQAYFPGDTLRGPESAWQALALQMAENDPGISGLLKITQSLAVHARHHNSGPRNLWAEYEGPSFPAWAIMEEAKGDFGDTSPRFEQQEQGPGLVLCSNPGKRRRVNAFVGRVGSLQRIYDLRPDVKALIDRNARWALSGFTLSINLAHPELALTGAEIAAIREMTSDAAAERWHSALLRPEMTGEELAAHLAQQRDIYDRIGTILSAVIGSP